MWKIIVLLYVTTGLAIMLFTRAREVMRELSSDINTRRYPTWKVIGFFAIAYPLTLLLWPLWLREWFSEKKTALDEFNENPFIQEQKSLFDLMNLMCEDGVDTDVIPGGLGEFGLVSSNPIPCKTLHGSITYLARLRTLDEIKIIYERAGSVLSDISSHPVDVYEISLPDGQKLETIYISPYHKRNSDKAPSGLMLA